MQHYFPVPPVMDGVGLNITMVSYSDELCFGIVTDRGQIEDAWPLVELFTEALSELEHAIQSSTNDD